MSRPRAARSVATSTGLVPTVLEEEDKGALAQLLVEAVVDGGAEAVGAQTARPVGGPPGG